MTTLPADIPLHLLSDGVRQRQRERSVDRPPWPETVPACFRSEAFAEDLLESSAGAGRHNAAPCDNTHFSWRFLSRRLWA